MRYENFTLKIYNVYAVDIPKFEVILLFYTPILKRIRRHV